MMITQAKKKTVTPDLFRGLILLTVTRYKLRPRNKSGVTVMCWSISQ